MEEINESREVDATRLAVDIFSRLAVPYRDKFMDVSVYGKGLDLFCSSLPNNATVLELACGPGNMTRYLLDKRPDLKILATDLSEEMLELARAACPEAAFELMDIRDISKPERQFDGILCGFGLPYISKEDAVQLIKDTSKVLTVGGVLYLSAMEDDYKKSGIETTSSGNTLFVYYHQEDYLREAILFNGFSIIDLERRDSVSGGKKVTDLIILAKAI